MPCAGLRAQAALSPSGPAAAFTRVYLNESRFPEVGYYGRPNDERAPYQYTGPPEGARLYISPGASLLEPKPGFPPSPRH